LLYNLFDDFEGTTAYHSTMHNSLIFAFLIFAFFLMPPRHSIALDIVKLFRLLMNRGIQFILLECVFLY